MVFCFQNCSDLLWETNLLKYGFWKKSIRKNATLNSWTLSSSQKGTCTIESYHLKKLYVMIYYYRSLFVKMKVFNYSELHFAKVTSYKIPTLEKFEFLFLSFNRSHILFALVKRRKISNIGKVKSWGKWFCSFDGGWDQVENTFWDYLTFKEPSELLYKLH